MRSAKGRALLTLLLLLIVLLRRMLLLMLEGAKPDVRGADRSPTSSPLITTCIFATATIRLFFCFFQPFSAV